MDSFAPLESRPDLDELVARAAAGERVVITRDGAAVAELARVARPDRQKSRDAAERLLSLRDGAVLGMDWRELRDEGRR